MRRCFILEEKISRIYAGCGVSQTPRYDKFSEEHYQRAYTVEEIKEALNFAGLEFVTVYDAFTRNEPNSESERIYVVARECQKNQVSK